MASDRLTKVARSQRASGILQRSRSRRGWQTERTSLISAAYPPLMDQNDGLSVQREFNTLGRNGIGRKVLKYARRHPRTLATAPAWRTAFAGGRLEGQGWHDGLHRRAPPIMASREEVESAAVQTKPRTPYSPQPYSERPPRTQGTRGKLAVLVRTQPRCDYVRRTAAAYLRGLARAASQGSFYVARRSTGRAQGRRRLSLAESRPHGCGNRGGRTLF